MFQGNGPLADLTQWSKLSPDTPGGKDSQHVSMFFCINHNQGGHFRLFLFLSVSEQHFLFCVCFRRGCFDRILAQSKQTRESLGLQEVVCWQTEPRSFSCAKPVCSAALSWSRSHRDHIPSVVLPKPLWTKDSQMQSFSQWKFLVVLAQTHNEYELAGVFECQHWHRTLTLPKLTYLNRLFQHLFHLALWGKEKTERERKRQK